MRKIHVMINPAAGQESPVLAALNDAWPADRVDWDVSILKPQPGDCAAKVERVLATGVDVVAVVGGDGTVCEVAAAMIGGDTPLAIIPGGTGNAVARDLGIPLETREAAGLAISPDAIPRRMDALRVGERLSLLRVGIGVEASTMSAATRELKNRLGWLAYPVAALGEISGAEPIDFRVTLDDERLDVEAFAVIVANVGRMGRVGARFPGDVDPFDGLANVFLVRSVDLGAIASIGARLLRLTDGGASADVGSVGCRDEGDPMWHLRASRVRVETVGDAVPLHIDGDVVGETPASIDVEPARLLLLTPPDETLPVE